MTECLLCKRELAETTDPRLRLHEEAEDCLVRVTDSWGISVDDRYDVVGDDIFHRDAVEEEAPPVDDEEAGVVDLVQFYPVERAILDVFRAYGLDRLGGRSTGSGWTNVALFQKCRYAWRRRYFEPLKLEHFGVELEIEPLAIGTLVHTYLAIYYQRMIVHDYPITPEDVNQYIRERGCNPKIFEEGWRLFTGYRLFYKNDPFQPLAVEFDLRDPRTNESCRYDNIMFLPEDLPGILAGTWIMEHKTAAKFDANTLEAWHGDGEVLGQVMLWERLGLQRKFGPLRGVIVNLLGKQKTPEFHRTIVAPSALTIDQHRNDLRHWNGEIAYAKATRNFPRSRANCIRGFQRCEFWHHCNSGVDD